MSVRMGAGDLVPWEGGCLLIGRALNVTPMHAHYAIQIGFGAERGIRFRTDERSDWTEYDAALIPSRQPHTMDATQVPANAIIFVEPETAAGRALAERYLDAGIVALDEAPFRAAAATLFSTWRAGGSADVTASAAREALSALAQGAGTRGGVGRADPACGRVHQQPSRPTADARGSGERSLPLTQSLPAYLRRADGDRAPALCPVAPVSPRVGNRDARRLALLRRAFCRLRQCGALQPDVTPHVRLSAVRLADQRTALSRFFQDGPFVQDVAGARGHLADVTAASLHPLTRIGP